MLCDKELMLARALVYHIKKRYPGENRVLISRYLNIKPSNLSRLFNLQALPGLKKILEIERTIGYDLLQIVSPAQSDLLAETATRLEHIESVLNIPIRNNQNPISSFSYVEEPGGNHYFQILNDPYYIKSFNNLLRGLEEAFQESARKNKLYFKVRKKERYVSINLIPENKVAGGYHCLMFRHSPSNHLLNVEFVTEKYDQFRNYLTVMARTEKTIKRNGITYTLCKLNANKDTFELYQRKDTHPSCIFTRPLTDVDLDLIINLALWTFNNK